MQKCLALICPRTFFYSCFGDTSLWFGGNKQICRSLFANISKAGIFVVDNYFQYLFGYNFGTFEAISLSITASSLGVFGESFYNYLYCKVRPASNLFQRFKPTVTKYSRFVAHGNARVSATV